MAVVPEKLDAPFRAIDSYDTRIREDAFCFQETEKGFRMLIAAPTPVPTIVNGETLNNSLRNALWSKKRERTVLVTPPKPKALQRERYSNSIVVRYEIADDKEVPMAVEVKQVRLRRVFTPQQYEKDPVAEYDQRCLMEIVERFGLKEKISHLTKTNPGGCSMTMSALSIFNFSCTIAALKSGSPFIGLKEKEGSRLKAFDFSPMQGVFNRSYRDPVCCINSMNLAYSLVGMQPVFSYEELQTLLPKNHRNL